MVHYQCVKCGSKNVNTGQFQKFEAEVTFYKGETEPAFGTKQEDAGSYLECKNCHSLGHPNDKARFMIQLDKY